MCKIGKTVRKSAWVTNARLCNGLARTPARFARANHALAWGRGPYSSPILML